MGCLLLCLTLPAGRSPDASDWPVPHVTCASAGLPGLPLGLPLGGPLAPLGGAPAPTQPKSLNFQQALMEVLKEGGPVVEKVRGGARPLR